MQAIRHHIFATDYGFAAIGWTNTGVVAFRLPASSHESAERALFKRHPTSTATQPPEKVGAVIAAAQRYFAGEVQDFSQVPVDLGEQEPLFLRIYDLVRKLGWGQTTTYGAVARDLGEEPQAARLVGEAMARNPVPLIIPCHRVLAAGGKIGGFSAPGGSDSKAHMLKLEGALPEPPAQAQMGFTF
ncbi:methylated-DNA--[protein]-cysteine S-methyltransferase [Novosphingobium terrae]|uniref:methylated-DNA--[protein]-cysteine S-methyltransferase n=1 Tax=Novosphingobium terrae TaxID=2726189 RepID=UPI00197EB39C|nr:methylated-DNA--[protein]-cysteine S-methyltransferase [Novosphingobium terrae]